MIHAWPAPLMLSAALWLAVPPDDVARHTEALGTCHEVEAILRTAPQQFRPPEHSIRSMVERCWESELDG